MMIKPPRSPGAYILTHVPTGRFYIGSTCNLYNRINTHLSNLRHGKHHVALLQEVFSGDLDMSLQIQTTPCRDTAYSAEQELLDRHHSNRLCCNAHDATHGNWKRGMPEERRRHLSNSRMGHEVPEHVRDAVRRANTGSKRGPETIRKMQEARARQPVTWASPVIVNGVRYESRNEAAAALGINSTTLRTRIRSTDPKWEKWTTG